MPRTIRKKSHSNIYHVILRSVNRQQIFYDAEDYQRFLNLLVRFRTQCGYKLHAYCLMGNHIHLLMQTQDEDLSLIFRRIGASYVYWYNAKYNRTGHLFQDRYKSEPVDSERYYLTVLRYIIRNPVKAGICIRPEDYEYSSGKEYILQDKGITDKEFSQSILGRNELKGFLALENDDVCLDMGTIPRFGLSDERAIPLIFQEFGTTSPSPGPPKKRSAFNASVVRLIRSGISLRQLSRLTGISKGIIERAWKTGKTDNR